MKTSPKEIILKVLGDDAVLTIPEELSHGDLTTNIALKSGGNPREFAEGLVKKLKADKSVMSVVEKVEVAGPGFINFFLKQSTHLNNLEDVLLSGNDYGKSSEFKGKKVMFEYGQPNTHKLPHIGHLFSYIYGESVTRLLEATGWEVRRVNYQGDVGLHVAKCLYAYMKANPKVPESLADKVKLLQEMYQEGSRLYDEDETVKGEIQELNKKIFEMDESIIDLWNTTRSWSVEYYREFEGRLGITFDRYYFESEVGPKGREKVIQNTPQVFKVSQEAHIFEGSKYGLHDRVFVTKYDTPTYEAKDLYLEELKMAEWPMDSLVITTANEQNEYFKVVFKALEMTNPEMNGKLNHIGFGMVNLTSGKMSSRTGNIVGGVELVDQIVEKVSKVNDDKDISEIVGLGAIKYSFLKNNPLQNTTFDIEASISAEGNSGPYLQYTVTRIKSLLEKYEGKLGNNLKLDDLKLTKEEDAVLRLLPQYSEAISSAAKSYSPSTLCSYLYGLASAFNTFYNKERILGEDNEEFKLTLAKGAAVVLTSGLDLLGINVPERM